MFKDSLTRTKVMQKLLELARKAALLSKEAKEGGLQVQVAIPFDPQMEKLIVAEGITCSTVFIPPDRYITLIGKI